jgi:hypothetical protein
MSKGRTIRIHPEHGLNPTMGVCFWCGQTDGTIAMLGAAYKGEAPRTMVLDYEPCDACRDKMALGIVCFQVFDSSGHERPPLDKKNPQSEPTGRWSVVKREAVERWLADDPPLLKATLESGRILVGESIWKKLGFPTDV